MSTRMQSLHRLGSENKVTHVSSSSRTSTARPTPTSATTAFRDGGAGTMVLEQQPQPQQQQQPKLSQLLSTRSSASRSTLNNKSGQLSSSFLYHMKTIHLFSCNNYTEIILNGMLFGSLNSLVASKIGMGPDVPFTVMLERTPAMLLWLFSSLFLFNLCNQRLPDSIEEDKFNKAWRPIPAGRCTADQATKAMKFMYFFLGLVALVYGGASATAIFMCANYAYNDLGGAENPIMKNAINGIGLAMHYAGPLEIATKQSIFSGEKMGGACWMAAIVFAFGTTSHVQDFRDVEGDAAKGRVTVPIALGDMPARITLSLGIVFWTGFACWLLEAGLLPTMGLGALALATMVNLFRHRDNAGDRFTWKKLYIPWLLVYCVMPYLSG